MKYNGSIIIADDEFSMRDLLGMIILGKFPYLEQEFYKSGDELERRLQKPPGDTRVVLTDNDMKQGKDGEELIEIYSKEKWSKIPMILHTGNENIRSERFLDNVFYYLEKPFKINRIYSVLKNALEYYDRMNSGLYY